jgi:tetratricopeptide (TPR) repeat protein
MRPRRVLIVLLGLGAILAAWFAVRAVEHRRFEDELGRARAEFAERRFGAARVRLVRLAERRPGDGEVEYLLGACEKIRGRSDAALAAWGRVPAGAPQAPAATLSRARAALEIGRYRLAEGCLVRLKDEPSEVIDEARRLLGWLYLITGRLDEHRDHIRQDLERVQDPSPSLRTLWSTDFDHYPLESISQTLAKAYQASPDDDRVWLGLANLAIRRGRFEEAGEWLARCEQAQPDDPAVLRARLEWAEASGRPDEVPRVAGRLPASAITPGRMLRLQSWLASLSGDRRTERAILERLVALEPSHAAVHERLADLTAQDGDADRVAAIRHRKAAAATALARYKILMEMADLPPHAVELARGAEACGRWIDERAWWRLAARRDPSVAAEADAAIARLAAVEPTPEPSGRTLADALGRIRPPREPEKTAVASRLTIPRFAEEAEARGLRFTFDHGPTDQRQMPESMSGGVGLIDFDGDGWLDVYAVQGGPFPPRPGRPPFGDRLFRNRGDGRFEDATVSSGLSEFPGGYGYGVAVGDYDNDGRPDLFVTRWRSYALYRNRGGGRFEDVTERAGLGGDRGWPTSSALADLDGDGDLDLYVCHYVTWDENKPVLCGKVGQPETVHSYCDPRNLPSQQDHVFRNDGGRFVDVTAEAGIVDRDGRGLGVVAADLDEDGRIDLFVANDTTANFFFHNKGGFTFEERGEESGLSAGSSGGYLAGMGVACGDLDGDGRIDLAVTNFFGESTTLYHNHGGGLFSDRGAATGLAAATRVMLGFGLAALDANNDGVLDLAQANGHIDDYRPTLPFQMNAQLILGDGVGGFVDVSAGAGPPWQVLRVARGLAVGDIDNDGRVDVLLVAQQAPLSLLRNEPGAGGHSLTLALEGVASNRDAVGATVKVTAGGRNQVATRFGGGSYISASDPRLHFGLGGALKADRVEVTWPSGRRDTYDGLAADGGYRLREGDPMPRPVAGFAGVVRGK